MSQEYHEPPAELSTEARDVHRMILTLIEEWEAVNWYNQRADVTTDEELKAIELHHRDEEIEHAAMALEWLRRRIPKIDEELRTYLFTRGPITEIEEGATGGGEGGMAGGEAPTGDLGIRKLQKGE